MITVLILVNTAWVQTRIAQGLADWLSNKTNFTVQMHRVKINWLDNIQIDSLRVYDREDSLMIDVPALAMDFDYQTFYDRNNPIIDFISVDEGRLHLLRDTESGYFNLSIFVFELQQLSKREKEKITQLELKISRIATRNVSLQINDQLRDSIKSGFDFKHFRLDDIESSIENFRLIADTVEMQVDRLLCHDSEGIIQLKHLSSYFKLTKQSIALTGLDLQTPHSHIKDTLILRYNQIANLSYFTDSVTVYAHLDESIISTQDIALLAPSMAAYDEEYRIEGTISGKISNLDARDIQLWLKRGSYLSGNLSFNGLPNIRETFMNLNLRNSSIRVRDLQPYLEAREYKRLSQVGDVRLTANLIGFPTDFVAFGTFDTDFGTVSSDLNFKIEGDRGFPAYVGNVTLSNFELGQMINRPDLIQKINLKGQIAGEGISPETASVKVDVQLRESGINRYVFDTLQINGLFESESFTGAVAIKDPNLRFAGEGTINLQEDMERFLFSATLDTIMLEKLGWTEHALHAHIAQLNLDFSGLDPDQIVGAAQLHDSYISYQERDLQVDSVYITSIRADSIRTLSWQSDRLAADLEGNYNIKELYANLRQLLHEYTLNYYNREEDILSYYSAERPVPGNFEVNYAVRFSNIDPFLNLFIPGLQISQNTSISGAYRSGYTSTLTMLGKIDTLIYNDMSFKDIEIDVHSSKIADSTDVLASVYLYSASQNIGNFNPTEYLLFEGIWDKSHIDFFFRVEENNTNSRVEVQGELAFLINKSELVLNNSDLLALGQPWKISNANKITFENGEVQFDSLRIYHEGESVAVNGTISRDSKKALRIDFSNFQLHNLNPVFLYDMEGSTYGNALISNVYDKPGIELDLDLRGFEFNSFLVGNVLANSYWNTQKEQFDLGVTLVRDQKEVMRVTGTIDPAADEELSLKAVFDKADISVAQSFLKGEVTRLKGSASGTFDIIGSIKYPILRGEGYLANGAGRIEYLKTDYTFEGPIYFDDNEIGFRDLQVFDINNNPALVNGGLFHDGFRNFVVDITGGLTNFQVLNTSARDNSLFYGTAYATGSINFLGALSNLNITAKARTARDTRFYIPIKSTTSAQQRDFIHFTDLKGDSILNARADTVNVLNLKGINLDFDLDITPDAYAEIIFDIRTGDIIRGRGAGEINMKIDTKGEFNMFGKYVFESGGYNFTFGSIINKEFAIQPKSEINWYGDPYAGIMDIKADYSQFTSMAPILSADESVQNHPDVRRRYPTNVILELEGELLQPNIDFDIEVEDYPDNIVLDNGIPYSLRLDYSAFQNKLLTDEQELKRQAFSLIVLKKFVPINSFQVAGGNSLGSSVSEFISNQLSYWVTQFDENLEIDVDLSVMDDEEYNTFQLRLSYTFLDGRLRVTRDGGFNNQTTNQADISSIAGDWTVEYLLTPDGRLRVKMYSRNSNNQVNAALLDEGNSNIQNTGVSLTYTRSFDEVKELLDFSRSKNRQPDKAPAKTPPADGTLPRDSLNLEPQANSGN